MGAKRHHASLISRESGLLKSWPEGGPKELWRVPLGEGYSGIVVVGKRLYTMYSADIDGKPTEVAAAFSAEATRDRQESAESAACPVEKGRPDAQRQGRHEGPEEATRDRQESAESAACRVEKGRRTAAEHSNGWQS